MEREVKIALAGNPNCGKTTLFNALTGANQFVGNWPGVTVEKKEGKLKGHKNVTIMDLPGIYSLSPLHHGRGGFPELFDSGTPGCHSEHHRRDQFRGEIFTLPPSLPSWAFPWSLP